MSKHWVRRAVVALALVAALGAAEAQGGMMGSPDGSAPGSGQGLAPLGQPYGYGPGGGYGMMGGFGAHGWGHGMMGGYGWGQRGSEATAPAPRFDQAQARSTASTFLAKYAPGANVLGGQAFDGYYTFDYGAGSVQGMLSVNAFTGEVWSHTWHGAYLGTGE